MACNNVNIPPQPEQEKEFTVDWVKWLRKLMDAVKALQTCINNISSDYYILNNNTYGGTGALSSITSGTNNIALGENAGASITTKNYNVFIGDSSNVSNDVTGATAVGWGSNTSGDYAVAIGMGSDAGASSVSVGESAGTGVGSVAVGFESVCDNNSIVIGDSLDITGTDDYIKIGDSSHTTVEIGPYDLGSLPTSGGSKYRGGTDTTDDIIIDSTTAGLVLLDTAGHYWRVKINTSGVLTTTDLGTTKP